MLHFLHVQSFIIFAITINLWRVELPSIPVKAFLGPIESFAVRQDFLLQRDREGGDKFSYSLDYKLWGLLLNFY